MDKTYEAPSIWTLGSVHDLTLMPKSGRAHDGSAFQANISCTDTADCPPDS